MKVIIKASPPKTKSTTLKTSKLINTTQAISKRFGVYNKDWDYYGFINSIKYDRIIQLSNGEVVLIRFKVAKNLHIKELLSYLKTVVLHRKACQT